MTLFIQALSDAIIVVLGVLAILFFPHLGYVFQSRYRCTYHILIESFGYRVTRWIIVAGIVVLVSLALYNDWHVYARAWSGH